MDSLELCSFVKKLSLLIFLLRENKKQDHKNKTKKKTQPNNNKKKHSSVDCQLFREIILSWTVVSCLVTGREFKKKKKLAC